LTFAEVKLQKYQNRKLLFRKIIITTYDFWMKLSLNQLIQAEITCLQLILINSDLIRAVHFKTE